MHHFVLQRGLYQSWISFHPSLQNISQPQPSSSRKLIRVSVPGCGCCKSITSDKRGSRNLMLPQIPVELSERGRWKIEDYSTLSLLSLHRRRSAAAICRVINSYCNLIELQWEERWREMVKSLAEALSLQWGLSLYNRIEIKQSSWLQVGGMPYISLALRRTKGHLAN